MPPWSRDLPLTFVSCTRQTLLRGLLRHKGPFSCETRYFPVVYFLCSEILEQEGRDGESNLSQGKKGGDGKPSTTFHTKSPTSVLKPEVRKALTQLTHGKFTNSFP